MAFASLTLTNLVLAQVKVDDESPRTQVGIADEKWQDLTRRYYLTRYRTQFTPNNSFLSLQDVRDILGNAGIRNRVSKHEVHQYWYWTDPHEPEKKIEAVFI